MRKIIVGFIAGFLAVLIFHQGLLALLHATGLSPRAAYAMAPTQPWGIPQVISASFWGGLWGILLVYALPAPQARTRYWMTALLFCALALSLVAWFVVAPIKDLPISRDIIIGARLLNGAWGLGAALLMRLGKPNRE